MLRPLIHVSDMVGRLHVKRFPDKSTPKTDYRLGRHTVNPSRSNPSQPHESGARSVHGSGGNWNQPRPFPLPLSKHHGFQSRLVVFSWADQLDRRVWRYWTIENDKLSRPAYGTTTTDKARIVSEDWRRQPR